MAPLVPGDAVVEQYRALLGEKIQLDDESSWPSMGGAPVKVAPTANGVYAKAVDVTAAAAVSSGHGLEEGEVLPTPKESGSGSGSVAVSIEVQDSGKCSVVLSH